MNNFLEYRLEQAIPFARRNDFYALFATNKAKHILNRHFSCSYSDTIYSKSTCIKKIGRCPFFESLPFLYESTFSECKGDRRESSDRKIYFNKNEVGTKSLICQTMILNNGCHFSANDVTTSDPRWRPPRLPVQDGGPHDTKMAAPRSQIRDGGPCDAFGYTSEGESTP